MSFSTTVQPTVKKMGTGEVIFSSPHNVSAFDEFEEGLLIGRFSQSLSGVISNLNGTATPTIAGVVKRKISNELNATYYTKLGQEVDQVAEVGDFGFMTVTVTGTAAPSRFDPVYAINATGADAGKATQNSAATGALAISGAVFWQEEEAGVWLIRYKI